MLVVDGLDEAEPLAGAPLGLPATLPDGVFVIATMRSGTPLRWIREEKVTSCKLLQASQANLDDMARYLNAAAREPEITGKLAAAGVSGEWFTATLLDRCYGVWIYLRYVLREIRDGTRAPENLDQLPRGLWSYYTENLNALRSDARQWDTFYLPLLATLAIAREPLTPATLAIMAGVPGQDGEVRRFVTGPSRPFCTAAPGDRYGLYHQSLREYLAGTASLEATSPEFADSDRYELSQATRQAHQRIADRYVAAWGGLSDGLPVLAGDLQAACLDDGYGLRHLPVHLEAAGRDNDVHRLLACQQPAPTSSGVSNTWYTLHDRAGTLDVYLDHIARAAALAYRATATARANGHKAPTIGLEIRYALINSSIIGLATNLPPELITALLAQQIWRPTQAVAHIRNNPSPSDRCSAFISVLPHLPETQRPGVLADALTAARAISDDKYRAQALGVLAPHLPESQRPGVLADALTAAQAISHDWSQAEVLGELAPHLPPEQLSLRPGRCPGHKQRRIPRAALAALAPHLPPELLSSALAAAQAISHDWSQAEVLARVSGDHEFLRSARLPAR